MIWWLIFEKKLFQIWRKIWIHVIVILLLLYIMAFSRESLRITSGIKKLLKLKQYLLKLQVHGNRKELEGLHYVEERLKIWVGNVWLFWKWDGVLICNLSKFWVGKMLPNPKPERIPNQQTFLQLRLFSSLKSVSVLKVSNIWGLKFGTNVWIL